VRRHAKASTAQPEAARKSRPKHLLVALLAALVVALSVSAVAVALQTHEKGTDIAPAGPNGFQSLAGLAVDASGGDLYALDSFGAADFSGAIDRFDSAGAFQNQITGTFNNPQDVAVDSTGGASDGNVYLADTGNNLILAFDSTGTPVASFDTDGVLEGSAVPALLNPDGAFSSPCGVAVDQTNGDLYVADQGHNRIWIFDSEGAYLGRIGDTVLQGPCGLALDSTGDLYVRNANTASVVKFEKVGATDFNYAGQTIDANNATDVAVDQTNDHVYVTNGNQVSEYDSSGSPVASFGSGGQLSSASGIAADPANAKVYVSEPGALHVYGPLVTLPDVSIGGASNVEDESATISGSVDPAGGPDASCLFEYDVDKDQGTVFNQTAPCDPAGPFNAFQEVTAELTGLDPGVLYRYRVSSSNANGTSISTSETFTTDRTPLISVVLAPQVNDTTAQLQTKINPNGTPTTYRFEYGTDTSYGSNVPVPDGDLGEGTSLVTATQAISGLQPGTTYHYRVSATNLTGTSVSDDFTFRTYAAGADGGLSPDRAYEMVSPPDKGGGDIQGNLWQTVSSFDGDAVSFASTGIFANAGGTGVIANYVARRTADGWVTSGLTPSQPPGNSFLPGQANQPQYYGRFSPDLSRGIFFARVALGPEPNVITTNNLYRRDDLLSGDSPNPEQGAQYQLLTNSSTPITTNDQGFLSSGAGKLALADANSTLDHVIYESKYNLTDDAVSASLPTDIAKLYEWDDGAQRLAGILPDGSPTTSIAGSGALAGGTSGGGANYTSNTLSESGSTVLFTGPPLAGLGEVRGNLYARLAHSVTVKLNESERTDCAEDPSCGGDGEPDPAPDPSGPDPAVRQAASADGSKIVFSTEEALTDDSKRTDPGDADKGGVNLYMYDANQPTGEHLTFISRGVRNVAQSSEDGDYVYFTSRLDGLDPDYTFPNDIDRNLYAWHNGEVRAVGSGYAPGGDAEDSIPWGERGLNFGLAARVTPDGRSFLFVSTTRTAAELSGQDLTPRTYDLQCNVGGRCATETYLYRYATDTLTCISCPPTRAAPSKLGGGFHLRFETGAVQEVAGANVSGRPTQYLTRALTDDGSRAFFTSFDPLVPTDTNGKADAYEYVVASDEVRLISTGQCNCESSFVEVTPDGSDVFFATAQQLVGIDKDTSRDLYDARVGGGIAAQNPAPPEECQGDACVTPVGAPNDPTPASSAFQGAGNPKKAKAKAKKQRRASKKQKRGKRKASKSAKSNTKSKKQTATRSHG
jgi:sugar lactone lactonase YvrE